MSVGICTGFRALLVLSALLARAAQAVVAPELDFPAATVVAGAVEPQVERHTQVLGALQSSGSLLQPERAATLRGQRAWVLYEVPRGVDEARVFAAAIDGLRAEGFLEDWTCAGSACGISNDWANRVFEEKRLYGLDRYQHYWTGSTAEATVAVYVIRRGNQRIYAWLQKIERSDRQGASDAAAAGAGRWVRRSVPGITVNADVGVSLTGPDDFRAFRLRYVDRTLVLLVGSGEGEDAIGALTHSERKAEQLRQWLEAQGLARWRVVAVGPALVELNRDVVVYVSEAGS